MKLLTKCNLLISLQFVDGSWFKHVPFSVVTDILWLHFYNEWLQLLLFQDSLNPKLLEERLLAVYKFQNLKTSLFLADVFKNKMSYFMPPPPSAHILTYFWQNYQCILMYFCSFKFFLNLRNSEERNNPDILTLLIS